MNDEIGPAGPSRGFRVSHAAGDSPMPVCSGDNCAVQYEVCGARVFAQAEDEQLADVLRQLFPAYRVESESDHEQIAARLSLGRQGVGFVVETANGGRILSASLHDAVDQVEFALTQEFLALCGDAVHLHASGVVVGDGTILVLGDSGRGKSSLALAWSVAGYPVLGDDVVLFYDDDLCHPFKRHFKVDPEVLRANGVDPADTPFWNSNAEEAWFDPESVGGWAAPAPIGVVAVSSHEAGADVAVRELPRIEGLSLLFQSRLKTGCSGVEAFDRLHRMVTGARVVEVRFGSAAEAAGELADFAS